MRSKKKATSLQMQPPPLNDCNERRESYAPLVERDVNVVVVVVVEVGVVPVGLHHRQQPLVLHGSKKRLLHFNLTL